MQASDFGPLISGLNSENMLDWLLKSEMTRAQKLFKYSRALIFQPADRSSGIESKIEPRSLCFSSHCNSRVTVSFKSLQLQNFRDAWNALGVQDKQHVIPWLGHKSVRVDIDCDCRAIAGQDRQFYKTLIEIG
jgi:hypothetical protein